MPLSEFSRAGLAQSAGHGSAPFPRRQAQRHPVKPHAIGGRTDPTEPPALPCNEGRPVAVPGRVARLCASGGRGHRATSGVASRGVRALLPDAEPVVQRAVETEVAAERCPVVVGGRVPPWIRALLRPTGARQRRRPGRGPGPGPRESASVRSGAGPRARQAPRESAGGGSPRAGGVSTLRRALDGPTLFTRGEAEPRGPRFALGAVSSPVRGKRLPRTPSRARLSRSRRLARRIEAPRGRGMLSHGHRPRCVRPGRRRLAPSPKASKAPSASGSKRCPPPPCSAAVAALRRAPLPSVALRAPREGCAPRGTSSKKGRLA